MTEEEWLRGDDRWQMMFTVAERMSHRKLRLARVAVCCHAKRHLVDERSRHALEVSEAHADGLVSDQVLAVARSQAKAAYESLLPHYNSQWNAVLSAALDVCCATGTESDLKMQADMIDIAVFAPKPAADSIPAEVRVTAMTEADLLRDIFGNPFRPVAADPSWLTPTAVALASAIYADRAYDRLPILADALEEAGCDHPDVLNHSRGDGPHVRGCWVVDLLLGKS